MTKNHAVVHKMTSHANISPQRREFARATQANRYVSVTPFAFNDGDVRRDDARTPVTISPINRLAENSRIIRRLSKERLLSVILCAADPAADYTARQKFV